MKWDKFKQWLADIRFWIMLFFVLRLFTITNPPIEVGHNWRQTTVTMVARNFLETDNNILYPRIDIAGAKTGITGMEFPFLNYLIYLCSLVFGYAHWYGRLINLLVSSVGLYYFYRLIERYFQKSMAFNASIFLLLSVWFTYSRKIMPDTFSMSLLFMGFYFGSNYLDKQKTIRNLLLYVAFTLLGILSKLPSGYLLPLFALLIFDKKNDLKTKLSFVIASVFPLAVIFFYYFYWAPYLTNHYGFSHFFLGKNATTGFSETISHLDQAMQKFYEEALGFSGFIIFLIGLGLAIYKREKKLVAVFVISFTGFIAIIFKSGANFYHHSYYIIPFAPVMALVAAYTISKIMNKKIAVFVLCLFSIEALLSKNHDFYIKEDKQAILGLEKTLDSICERSDLIAINSGNVPTPMYFAHRKGWVEFNENLLDPENINTLKSQGLKFIVVLKRVFGTDVILPYKQIEDNRDFRIYKL